MQQTLEAGGLEAGAELLVDPGVEGDREPHVEPGGDRPPRHLLPRPPDRRYKLKYLDSRCILQIEPSHLTGPPSSVIQDPPDLFRL